MVTFKGSVIAQLADKDVQPAILIDICKGDSGRPAQQFLRIKKIVGIRKFEIALVEIKLVSSEVGSKKQIRQSIIVEIAGSYAAAIVKIEVIKDIEVRSVGDFIVEINIGLAWRKLDKRAGLLLLLTSRKGGKQNHDKK